MAIFNTITPDQQILSAMVYRTTTDHIIPVGLKFILIVPLALLIYWAIEGQPGFLIASYPAFHFFLFFKKGIVLDLTKFRYKKYYSVFPFTFGKWQDITDPEFVCVDRYPEKEGSVFSKKEIDLFAVYIAFRSSDQMELVYKTRDPKDAAQKGVEMAKIMNVPVREGG